MKMSIRIGAYSHTRNHRIEEGEMKTMCSAVAVLLSLLVIGSTGWAIPQLMNYQGYLTDDLGNPVSNGTYSLTFRIWDAETGPNQLWSEDHPTVSVTNGLFDVILGSMSPLDLPFDVDYWLGVQVEGEPELTRVRLTSVGYSYRAAFTDTAEYAVHAPRADSATHSVYADTASWTLGGGSAAYADTAGYAFWADTSDYALSAPATPDDDWAVVSNILYPVGNYGLSMRQSNVLYGSSDTTHVNFGIACTTGASGLGNAYCTVSGGRHNVAGEWYATVGGGYLNSAKEYYSTVCGGNENSATQNGAAVGGGLGNVASGYYATVGGGWRNQASGNRSAVGGGQYNEAGGDYSFAAGDSVLVTADADYTFGFGRSFTTSTPNAVIFHNSRDRIRVGIGTTSPDAPLTIQTAVGTELNFPGANNTDITANSQLNITAGTSMLLTGGDIYLRTNYQDRVYVSNTGDVGIGTTIPQTTLHVSGIMRLEPQSVAPPGSLGDLYVGTDTRLYFHNGVEWKEVSLVP